MIELDDLTLEAMNKLDRNHIKNYAWEPRLSLWPRKSSWSNDRIRMFRTAYRGQRIIHGPGEPVLLVAWLTPEEFIIQRLKGNV